MQHKNEELFKALEKYIDDYKAENCGNTPTVRQAAAALRVSASTVSVYLSHMREQGIIEYAGHRNIITRASKAAHTDVSRVPLLGEVACGIPKLAEENIEEYIKLPASILGRGSFFALRAKGDSMINAGIDDGDLVIVRQQNTADYNQIVVALVDDEATLKRFRPENGVFRLHAENPDYPDIIVESCIVQGVAVKVIKDIE